MKITLLIIYMLKFREINLIYSEMTLRVVFTIYCLVMHYHAKFSCSNITISKNFREINSQYVWLVSLSEFLQKNLSGNMYVHSLKLHHMNGGSYVPQCRNCRNSLSHFYRKNFVKAMVLLNSWFDEIYFSEREFLVFPHCASFPNHCTEWRDFRIFLPHIFTWNQF